MAEQGKKPPSTPPHQKVVPVKPVTLKPTPPQNILVRNDQANLRTK
jgi:hypothetical protein